MEFSIRSDSWINLKEPLIGTVTRVFNHGFDAHFAGNFEFKNFPVFFTQNVLNIHPLAIKVPLWVQGLAEEKLPIRISQNELQIGEKIVSRGPDIVAAKEFCVDLEAVGNNHKILADFLNESGRESYVKTELSLDLASSELRKFVSHYSVESRLEIPMQLVGKGEGLTPASDDFLSAFIILDRLAGKNKIVLDSSWLQFASRKTTFQSVLQYMFAGSGLSTIGFEMLVKKFLQQQVCRHELFQQLKIGHSSGSDMLYGVLNFPIF